MEAISFLGRLLQSGAGNLGAYLAAHVLLCLLPAFFIAGAMTALIPKETITRFLGRNTPRWISYPAAALAGSVLAVCSCTIIPLFAGIYRKGAGLGPAITFLFFAPASNILAIIYTGNIIGLDFALARLILSLVFGIVIGLAMALLFHREDAIHDHQTDKLFAAKGRIKPAPLAFLLMLFCLLIFGTLKVKLLSNDYASFTLPALGLDHFQSLLARLVPFDPAKGEEGVTVQGAALIGLLILIFGTGYKGFANILDGANRWTITSLGLVAAALLLAALAVKPQADGLKILVTGRFFALAAVLAGLAWISRKHLEQEERRQFLWESWKFIKEVFPLLVAGVFAVGIIRGLINPAWVKTIAGTNSIFGCMAGVTFGVFMYFPTLVEVPIAHLFLSLGMHRGPLLAYLLADPELSLQSILILVTILGRRKTWTYVGLVALFSACAGLIYGSWVDGVGIAVSSVYITTAIAILALSLWRIDKNIQTPHLRKRPKDNPPTDTDPGN